MQAPEEIIDRICFLSMNGFVYSDNNGLPQWVHKSGHILVKHNLAEYTNADEWDRLTDSIEYFMNKNNF